MNDKNNINGTNETIYDGSTTNASNDGTEWWETEEGIEAMKAKELKKYEEYRNPPKRMNLGTSIKIGGNE